VEPTFRTLEILARLAVVASGARVTYDGEDNIPERGGVAGRTPPRSREGKGNTMGEPFFRFAEVVVPPIVALQGTKLKFEGLEHIPARGGGLVALNHTSYLDWLPASIAAKERGRRLRFMIKAEMADVKAVNYVIKHAQLIPVDRRQGHDAYALAVERLRQGELVGLHPEATISRSYELRDFKTGTVRMALEARVPILPLIVWGAHRIWPKDHPKKLLRNKVPITVAAGRPLPPQGTPEQLNGALRQAMNLLLYRVQEEYPHPQGEFWVPRRLGGGAPTRDDSRALRFAELQERAQRYGSDGVTRPGQSRSGLH
jgi:1-acyl-sn-glycerol-3-phosphate acyltransferase